MQAARATRAKAAAQAPGCCIIPHCWPCQSATTAAASAYSNAVKARQKGSGRRWTATAGGVLEMATTKSAYRMPARTGLPRAAGEIQAARRNTSVPLVPPKPKLFFTATSIFIGRATLAQ